MAAIVVIGREEKTATPFIAVMLLSVTDKTMTPFKSWSRESGWYAPAMQAAMRVQPATWFPRVA